MPDKPSCMSDRNSQQDDTVLDSLWESDLSLSDLQRYSRQIVVPRIGVDGHKAVGASRVLVVGAGGLGSPVVMYLAMAGVGTLGVVDFDRVELHNLQRQSIHTEKSIGRLKTESAAEYVRSINSSINIIEHSERVSNETCRRIFENYELILDCCDQIEARYVINDCCRELGIDLINASSLRWEGQLFVAPREGNCYRCVFPSPKTASASCDSSGVVGPVCGIVGSLQATEAIKLLVARARRETVAAKIVLFDGWKGSLRAIEKVFPSCFVCRGESAPAIKLEACANSCVIKSSVNTLNWKDLVGNLCQYCVVDIRSPVHYEMFRMKGAVNERDVSRIIELGKKTGKKIAVLCYRGNSSVGIAEQLRKAGVDAYSVKGGIEELKKAVGL